MGQILKSLILDFSTFILLESWTIYCSEIGINLLIIRAMASSELPPEAIKYVVDSGGYNTSNRSYTLASYLALT